VPKIRAKASVGRKLAKPPHMGGILAGASRAGKRSEQQRSPGRAHIETEATAGWDSQQADGGMPSA
jgi:hypothetical protein